VSAAAGTIFDGTRTPLMIWFAAGWQMTSQKHGISALGLKRTFGIGSEQTAWAMLHHYRTAMVRLGRERLTGIVEVDETFLGGPEPGRRGRGAVGKTMVEIAVEQDGRALGRCWMQVIGHIGAPTLREFLLGHVEPGSVVLTDGLASYRPACGDDYTHRPEPIGPSGLQAHEPLPGVHRVASLAQRWLLGTHQGGVKAGHMQAYLDEFTCRFNRRRSRARGMLFYRRCSSRPSRPRLAHTARSSSTPAQDAGNCPLRRPTSACARPVWTGIPSIDVASGCAAKPSCTTDRVTALRWRSRFGYGSLGLGRRRYAGRAGTLPGCPPTILGSLADRWCLTNRFRAGHAGSALNHARVVI
jgi:transposase-like protein